MIAHPRLRRRGVLAAGAAGLFLATTGFSAPQGGDYHVSPEGDDNASGSAKRPWRSLARVNSASLAPGERVLFARGGVWEGETLRVQPGVTYAAAEGEGPPPRLSGATGPGVVFGEKVAAARIQGLSVTHSQHGAVWIDKAGPGNAIIDCHFTENVQDRSRHRNLAAYHTSDLTIAGCDFSHCHGDDHVYLFNCPNAKVIGNRIEWHGPQDGDCIHASNSDDFLIAGNELIYHAGGKGCLIISPWREDQRGGVIEDNRITGGQYGISPRVRNCIVRRNHIRRVGLQDDARSWSSGIWIATGGHPLNAHGIEISDCVVENCPRAIYGWDDLEAQSASLNLRNSLLLNCPRTYFGHENGRIDARLHDNIVVNCGPLRVTSPHAFVHVGKNHFHNTEGEEESGPPGLAKGFYVPAGAPAHGTGPRAPLAF